MNPVELKKGVYWVGEIDWDLRNFHGYLTHRGSTYNAYLVIDEKITLIDNVRPYLFDKMLKRLSSVIDPAKINYVICNHVEMDHSGTLPHIMDIAKNATIITSPNGKKGLLAHYKRTDWNFKVVETNEVVRTGQKSFKFFLTKMVHWPDNMVSYLSEDNILFSNDAFGQHIASSERFDDEISLGVAVEEAKKYYANIVLPYSMQVKKALDQLSELPIDMIAPSHGIIWRSHMNEILDKYNIWADNKTENQCLIIYDTMWKSTEKMAYTIQEAFEENNIDVKMIHLKYWHISDVIADVLSARFICVGSPTLNNNMLPTVSGFLTYMKGLSPKKRTGLAFGSYGWSGQSVSHVEEALKDCGFDLFEKIKIQYVPDDSQLNEIRENLKKEIAKRLS